VRLYRDIQSGHKSCVAKNLLENRREKSSVSSLFRPLRYDGQNLRFWPDRYVLFLRVYAMSRVMPYEM